MCVKVKIRVLLTAMSLAYLSAPAHAQWFVRVGSNLSNMAQSDYSSPLEGGVLFAPALGIGYGFRLGEAVRYEPSLYYSNLGRRRKQKDVEEVYRLGVHALVLDHYLTVANGRWHLGFSPSVYYVFLTTYFSRVGSASPRLRLLKWADLRPFAVSPSLRLGYSLSEELSLYVFYRRDLNGIGNISSSTPTMPLSPDSSFRGTGFGLHLQYRLGK